MAKSDGKLKAGHLRALLSYDAKTGKFTARVSRAKARAGNEVGSTDARGYVWICIERQRYYAHRLAWLWTHGQWPKDQLDHVNGDTSDNRLANLRECTNAQNGQNYGLRKNNKSGLTGVHWSRERNKWCAAIRIAGKMTGLGRYGTQEEAHAAYLAAKRQHHTFQPTPRGL